MMVCTEGNTNRDVPCFWMDRCYRPDRVNRFDRMDEEFVRIDTTDHLEAQRSGFAVSKRASGYAFACMDVVHNTPSPMAGLPPCGNSINSINSINS